MSYASDVKEELYAVVDKDRHCQIAELAAILSFSNKTKKLDGRQVIVPDKEDDRLYKTYCALNKRLGDNCDIDNELITRKICTKRAYIRGAFLAAGTMSDPNKSYQFEIVSHNNEQAVFLRDMMLTFDINPKIVRRKNCFVVYLKEGSDIVEILNVMKAHIALMDLENVRIMKEMRGSVNRKVNCETANITKMVNASVKQIEDIEYIQKTIGLSKLPEALSEMALVRLEYPDMPLKELGNYLSTPIGKSGVNHRLRRISEIAQKLKEE